MRFQKHDPHPFLQSSIDKLWTLKSDDAVSQFSARSYPDGCVTIIFNFGDPISLTIDDQPMRQSPETAYLYGNVTRYFQFELQGTIDLISINFKPGKVFPLLNIPLNEFTNLGWDCRNFSAEIGDELFSKLGELSSANARIQLLEDWLLGKYSSKLLHDPVTTFVTKQISLTHGNLNIESLADKSGISLRQLERKFQQQVGISPKSLGNILRFRRIQDLLKSPGKQSLLHIAYDHGYFDHAHLTRDFKKFAGVTPSYFSQYLPYF